MVESIKTLKKLPLLFLSCQVFILINHVWLEWEPWSRGNCSLEIFSCLPQPVAQFTYLLCSSAFENVFTPCSKQVTAHKDSLLLECFDFFFSSFKKFLTFCKNNIWYGKLKCKRSQNNLCQELSVYHVDDVLYSNAHNICDTVT